MNAPDVPNTPLATDASVPPAALPDTPAATPDAVAAPTDTAAVTPDVPAATPDAPAAAPEPSLSPAQTAARLAELFPACFAATPPQPLKLRIQADIQERAPNTFTRKSLSAFLHRHTGSTAYLKALANAPHRIDLDGQPAGEVSDEHRQAAQQEVQRRKALHDERRAAERAAARDAARQQRGVQAKADDAQRDAQRQAREAARRAAEQRRETEGQGRAERAALLRAYEASSLSRANFCTLKRIDEAQLDALLAQAREERDRQRAPAARGPAQPDQRTAASGGPAQPDQRTPAQRGSAQPARLNRPSGAR